MNVSEVHECLVGKRGASTTLDTYGHLFECLDDAAAERLDALGNASGSGVIHALCQKFAHQEGGKTVKKLVGVDRLEPPASSL